MTQASNHSTSFLDLPAEVRKQVYINFFSSQRVLIDFETNAFDPDEVDTDRTLLPHAHTRIHPPTNLFLVSRTIYLESKPLFFPSTIFNFVNCPWGIDNVSHNTGCICLSRRIGHQVQHITFSQNQPTWGSDVYHASFLQHYALAPSDVLVVYDHIVPFAENTRHEFSNFGRMMTSTQNFDLSIDMTFRVAVVFLRIHIHPDRNITILERNVHCTDKHLRMIVECYLWLDTEDINITTDENVVVHTEADPGWGTNYGPALV